MYENKKVLKSKLRFSGASETIIRDRLMPILSNIQTKRLTMVIAGAGYGKTTLVKQAVLSFKLPAVWYRLDKYDSDFETFFSYLKAGMEEHLGDIEISIEENLQDVNKVEKILHFFLKEIENRIQHEFVIVLDDYYLVHDNDEVNRAVKFLIENMHHKIHLVLISRAEPPIKISSLRVRRDVLDLTESDLAFTISEIKKLYSDVFQLSLQSRTFADLQKKTGGWVAALILFFHSLKGKSQETADNDLLKIKGSNRIIATYLEENAYEMLPPETKDFLVKTSLLSKVKVAFCNQLLRINNSKEILSDLEKRHLFTFQLDDEKDCFTYHHIFQDFLRTKLDNNYCKEEIQDLQKKTAQLLEQDGNEEEALEYYLESEQMEDSFRIIGKISTFLWSKGRRQRIKSYLKHIPSRYFQKEPWINFLKAQWLDLTGKTQEAVQCLEQSAQAFLNDKVPYGAALCLMRLGYQNHMDGDFPKAERTYKQAVDIFVDNIELTTILYLFIIDTLAQQGKFEQADLCYNKAMTISVNPQDSQWRLLLEGGIYTQIGNRHLLSGNFQRSNDFLKKSKQLFENSDFYALFTKNYYITALTNYYMGDFSEGLENAQKGLNLMRDKGFEDFFPSAWLNFSAARNCLELNKTIEATEHIKESLRNFENIGSDWGRAMCYLTFYQIHKHSGDDAKALKNLSQCEAVIGQYKIPWAEFELNVFKAGLYIEKSDFQKARQILETSNKELKLFRYLNNRINFVWARYYWAQNDKEMAFQKLLKGIKICQENQYYFLLSVGEEGVVPILVELFASGKEQLYIKKIFNQMGMCARSSLIDLQKSKSTDISKAASEILTQMPAPSLRVSCLGEFKLYRGNTEIPAEKWTSQNAKLLFKFLLTERSRGFIPKEVLIEMLWPEQDSNKTSNRLRVTLSALRKILEPELIKGMMSSYILNDANGYKLHLGKDGWSDINEFREEIILAEDNETDLNKSIHHYLKVESTYKGAFLAEDLYVDWIAEKKEYYRDSYLHAISRIIEHYENRKDFLKCIDYSKKYLTVDVYAENIYQKLMKYYLYTGNTAMLKVLYEKCKQNIVDDLCSPLSQKTESLYEELLLEKI
uniref:Transcriptional regulator n=1 Tax=uncultured bacterium pFosPlaG TaxID=491370 RepID=B0FB23_9BACT|nr:transcriptional regulator [uncultured bacterium pFosPlaG]